MSHFEYTDPDGLWITALPYDGRVLITTGTSGCAVPLDRLEEVIAGLRDMGRQAGQQTADRDCQCLPASPVEGNLTCDQHLPTQPTETFTVAERQFLSFALDLASDRMASRGDEFTEEDHAALGRFRRMAVGEAGA